MLLPLLITSLVVAVATSLTWSTSIAHAGAFHVECTASHSRMDDPIVHPGVPESSHLHRFYGARTTRAESTVRSLLDSRTTCGDRADTAAYWHPALRVSGRPVGAHIVAWYSRGGKRTVEPMPLGIKLLAGSMDAQQPQSGRFLAWRCTGPRRSGARRLTPVLCPRGMRQAALLSFPDCWNGADLDSLDHRSHVAYSRRGRCPSTHAVPIPRLVMEIVFATRAGAPRITLSSGSWTTFHGDFWSTWAPRRMARLTRECLEIDDDCGLVGRAVVSG